jgi:hypothetical protein
MGSVGAALSEDSNQSCWAGWPGKMSLLNKYWLPAGVCGQPVFLSGSTVRFLTTALRLLLVDQLANQFHYTQMAHVTLRRFVS